MGIFSYTSKNRCSILQGNVLELPFSNEKFDIACAFEIIYFWPEAEKSFHKYIVF